MIGKVGMARLSLAVLMVVSMTASAQLKASTNGHYLTENDGTPVFLNGESAWQLFVSGTMTEVDSFFINCQQYGINFLQTMLIHDGQNTNSPPSSNLNGDTPFTGANFTTPRESYFTHADSIIGLAKSYGIYLHLYIAYLGSNADQGWQTEITAASIADMKAWGDWIGTRYKDSTNIVWGISGDTDPSTWQQKIDSMTVALLAVDVNHLVSPRDEPNTRAATHWSARPYVTLEYIYPYWGPQGFTPSAIITHANAIWNDSIPGFMEEGWYENEYDFATHTILPTTQQLQQQMYYGPLAGALAGQTFGNCPTWNFGLYCAGCDAGVCGDANWRNWQDSQGHQSTGYCGNLFRSRYWYKLRPDITNVVMTAGFGTGETKAVAAKADDGSSIICYSPDNKTLTIDPSGMAGDSVRVYRYTPSTGAAAFVGSEDTGNTFNISTTAEMVVVIDSKSFDALFDVPGGNAPGAIPIYLNWRK